MKAVIKSAEFVKEYDSKFGTLYQHRIKYDDKTAFYSSKKKEQSIFVVGKEVEFLEEQRQGENGMWYIVKPMTQNNLSGYAKNIKKEQSRYSGFAVSYVKDLIIADKIKIEQWEAASKKIFQFMVDLDKTLES
jgi:hypothetical protein